METAEVAQSLSITPETVRSHLKSIYRKTATSSRPQLIQAVKCGPALLGQHLAPRAEMFAEGEAAKARRNQIMTLSQDRRLGFAEYGAQDGVPIVLIHNLIGSRLQIPGNEKNFVAQNLRIIAPDRPGVGLSDLRNDHSLEAWCGDIAELLDRLELQRVYLVGSSLGAVYGLALARYLPQRTVFPDAAIHGPSRRLHEPFARERNALAAVPALEHYRGGSYSVEVLLPGYAELGVHAAYELPMFWVNSFASACTLMASTPSDTRNRSVPE